MYEFKMPSLGAEMTRGKLLEWKVKVGDRVKKHDIIAVIDTDKAAIEIESFADGVVEKLIATLDEFISVGTVMALIQDNQNKTETPIKKTSVIKISPLAKKHAQELNIDISCIKGSGPDGAIIEGDIQSFISKKPVSSKEDKHGESMKKIIAAAMEKSKRDIPHYYLSIEINFQNAWQWLSKYNEKQPMPERLLYVVLLIKATIRAIEKFPEFNGFYINNQYQSSDVINPGIAISLRDGGLIAPAILNINKMTLVEIMQHLTDLVERVRAGRLRNTEISDATVTITNLGELGADLVFGIIYPPQVAIIGFGKISENKVIIASLSADHRVTNGLQGSRFLAAIDKLLQEPEKL